MFKIIESRKQKCAPQLQLACHASRYSARRLRDDGDGVAGSDTVNLSDAVHEVLWHLAFSMFGVLHFRMENSLLFTFPDEKQGEWPDDIKCQLEKGKFAM